MPPVWSKFTPLPAPFKTAPVPLAPALASPWPIADAPPLNAIGSNAPPISLP